MVAVTLGGGEFSLTASLLDLLKQLIVGIVAGAVLGYLAALLIAHERWGFLAEYAPVVTLAAVIGAYLAADGLQASGFTAVFVFGIVLGNQSSFGFRMKAGEAQKLQEYVTTTSFIMRLYRMASAVVPSYNVAYLRRRGGPAPQGRPGAPWRE